MAGTPIPIIIDTDPGVDDAMAIAMAFASPELDVRMLTTVFGNAKTDITTRNTLGLLALAGRTDIPVLRGAEGPLISGIHHHSVPQVHGHDGLGDAGMLDGLEIEEPAEGAAAIALIDAAKQSQAAGKPLTIVALGPLTNLALALHLEPAIATMVERVVVMGGNAFAPGNATPAAEANMLGDPEAADIVFGADWPVTMIGLDVTHKVIMTSDQIAHAATADTFGGLVMRKAVPLYHRFFEQTNNVGGIYAHDPSVIAWILESGLFETRPLPLRVETQNNSRGKTWPFTKDTDNGAPEAWQGRPLVDVAVGVDGEGVAELVGRRLVG